MHSPEIDFYFFSGTGNTLLVAKRMAERLSQSGCKIRLLPLERADPQTIDLDRALGLGFPVAAQTTYPLVWAFAEQLPSTDGTEAFMVDTMAGYSGGIVGPLGKCLADKGYRLLGAQEIVMPLNFGRIRLDTPRAHKVVSRGLQKADEYAQALLAGNSHWGRVPVLSDLMCAAGRSPLTWKLARWLGHRMHVDQNACTQCGICAQICSTGNIRMADYPAFQDRCQQCMRCVGFCPTGALSVPGAGFSLPYRALSLNALQHPNQFSTRSYDPSHTADRGRQLE
jgi:ferredoxin